MRDPGYLTVGYHADIVVFDPATIIDHASDDSPMQYATGVSDVFVNGVQVLRNGEYRSHPGTGRSSAGLAGLEGFRRRSADELTTSAGYSKPFA